MAKVRTPNDLSNLSDPASFARYASILLKGVVNQMNGRMSFTENISCALVDVVFPAANADYTFPHNLGRTPIGYIPVKKLVSVDV